MSTARMLSVSIILTLCLATIGTLILLFTGEKSPLKALEEKEPDVANAAPSSVSSEEAQTESSQEEASEGIRTETDALGFHDILFENDQKTQKAVSGPVELTITKRRLELLTTEDASIQKSMEGRKTSVVVVLDVQVTNTSDQLAIFKMDEAKITTDTGENAVINARLSTTFGEQLAPKETKKGKVMIDLASKARDIATLQLQVFPAYDANYDALGEAVYVKIPMF